MPLTMNEQSKNNELKHLLLENETYISRTWASLVSSTPRLLTYCVDDNMHPKIGSSNIYCYIGLSNTFLGIITLHSLDVTKVTGRFRIPLDEIKNIELKNGIMKCSATIEFENERFKLLWINEALGTDMKQQRKNIKAFCEYFKPTTYTEPTYD